MVCIRLFAVLIVGCFPRFFVGFAPFVYLYFSYFFHEWTRIGCKNWSWLGFDINHFHLLFWIRQDSNPQPLDCESSLLTTRPDSRPKWRPRVWIGREALITVITLPINIFEITHLDEVAEPSFPDQSSPEWVLGELKGDVFRISALKEKKRRLSFYKKIWTQFHMPLLIWNRLRTHCNSGEPTLFVHF